MNAKTIARVAALQHMESSELRDLWKNLFNESAPSSRCSYLVPRLAYRIQELAYGGLSKDAQQQLEGLVKTKKAITSKKRRIKKPIVGTRLIREYKGTEHHVTVTRSGFEYQGKTYKSLSQIAREITGTRWSGPLFFGLKGATK